MCDLKIVIKNVFMLIIYILNVVLEENNVWKCVKRISYYYNKILNMIILAIEHIKFRYMDTILFLYI